MRWNVVNYFFHRFHRFSYINLPQKSMQRIFVGNAVNFAVNFCMKRGEIFIFPTITAFLTKIHRIHHISYKDLLKNLDPGKWG